MTPHLQLCGQESAPQHRSHIPYLHLRPVQRPPSTQFAARQMVASRRRFFINTTRGLVVMTFKLCQEGNRQPFGSTNRFRKRIV